MGNRFAMWRCGDAGGPGVAEDFAAEEFSAEKFSADKFNATLSCRCDADPAQPMASPRPTPLPVD